MLDKINQLLKIKETLDQLQITMNALTSSFKEVQHEHTVLRQDIQELKEEQQEVKKNNIDYLKSLKESLAAMQKAKEEFESEITEMKITRTRMAQDSSHAMVHEFQQALQEHLSKLDKDLQHYASLKTSFHAVATNFDEHSKQLSKFNAIAQTIKESDFNLQKYARFLEGQDKEKLELLRKIDALERLISKERRKI